MTLSVYIVNTVPDNLIAHKALMVCTPVRADSIPAIALKLVAADWANPGPRSGCAANATHAYFFEGSLPRIGSHHAATSSFVIFALKIA